MIPSAAMSDVGGRRYRHFLTAASISAHTYVITWDCTHWPLYMGGRGVLKSRGLLTLAALSSRSDLIRIVFSLPMLPSLVCWIGPTAVRKKVAMVPQGRGFLCMSSSFHYPVYLLTFYLLLWNYSLILKMLTETLHRIPFSSVIGRCSKVPISHWLQVTILPSRALLMSRCPCKKRDCAYCYCYLSLFSPKASFRFTEYIAVVL